MTLYILAVLGAVFSVTGALLTGIVSIIKTIQKKK